MGTKKVAKKKVMKKDARKTAAAKRLPRVSPREVTRWATPSDDQESADVVALHERIEPRELSHERLRNAPEETATPAPDEDLVDDVAASAGAPEGGTAEEDDEV